VGTTYRKSAGFYFFNFCLSQQQLYWVKSMINYRLKIRQEIYHLLPKNIGPLSKNQK